MKISKIMSFGLAGLIAFIWMGSVTYAAETVRGVTADSIRIGVSIPLTKFIASEGRKSLSAIRAYTNFINDRGGIHGRKVELIVDDSQLDPGVALGIWKKQISTDNIFAHLLWGTPPATVLLKPAMEEKVPLLILGGYKKIYVPAKKYVFTFQPPAEVQAASCLTFIRDTLNRKDAKIAIFWRNDDWGRTVLVGGKAGANYYNMEIVAEPSYMLGQAIDFPAEVMKIKRSGADFVLLGAEPASVASFLREAKSQGLKAGIIGALTPISERKIIRMAGQGAENYTAVFCTSMFRETDIPGVKKMIDISKKYVSSDILAEESYFYSIMWHFMSVIEEGLKRAGSNPTPESFVDGLESIKGFTAEGLGAPVTYSPTKHYSSDSFFFGKANMKIEDYDRLSDWITPPQVLLNEILK